MRVMLVLIFQHHMVLMEKIHKIILVIQQHQIGGQKVVLMEMVVEDLFSEAVTLLVVVLVGKQMEQQGGAPLTM